MPSQSGFFHEYVEGADQISPITGQEVLWATAPGSGDPGKVTSGQLTQAAVDAVEAGRPPRGRFTESEFAVTGDGDENCCVAVDLSGAPSTESRLTINGAGTVATMVDPPAGPSEPGFVGAVAADPQFFYAYTGGVWSRYAATSW